MDVIGGAPQMWGFTIKQEVDIRDAPNRKFVADAE